MTSSTARAAERRPASVAGVVITFNRREVLRQSLSSLTAQTRPLDEIIVVDNASSDGTDEMLSAEFPSVSTLTMAENSGAAGGFAAGLREGMARGHDWMWVFNDDDFAEPEALATMLEAAAQLPPRTGVVACARREPGGEHYPLGARWRHRHIPVRPADPNDPPFPLDVVTLSSTLVSADTVREVGVPKGDYFMMIEDLEYCLRIRRAGWQIYVVPQPLATALAMGSTGASPPWRGYYQTRNQLAMTLEHRSVPEFFWWLVRTLKFSLSAIRSRDRPIERVRLRALGAWHALRQVSGRTIH